MYDILISVTHHHHTWQRMMFVINDIVRYSHQCNASPSHMTTYGIVINDNVWYSHKCKASPFGSLRGPKIVKRSPPPSLSSRFDMTHVPSRVSKGTASEWYFKVEPSVDVSVVNTMFICACVYVFVCVWERVCVCVCVYVSERDRELRRVLRPSGILRSNRRSRCML